MTKYKIKTVINNVAKEKNLPDNTSERKAKNSFLRLTKTKQRGQIEVFLLHDGGIGIYRVLNCKVIVNK